jgi:hypothetical protein
MVDLIACGLRSGADIVWIKSTLLKGRVTERAENGQKGPNAKFKYRQGISKS